MCAHGRCAVKIERFKCFMLSVQKTVKHTLYGVIILALFSSRSKLMHSCWFRRRFCRLPGLTAGVTSAFSSSLEMRLDAWLETEDGWNSASDDATDAAWRVWTDVVMAMEQATSSSFNDPTFATNKQRCPAIMFSSNMTTQLFIHATSWPTTTLPLSAIAICIQLLPTTVTV